MIKIMIETNSVGFSNKDVSVITGRSGFETKYGVLIQVDTFEEARDVFQKWTDWVTIKDSSKSVSNSYIVDSNTFELNLI